jgi:peptidoglycan/xylan/chitin deacetylase (PgdA/CDA1 family)
MYFLSTPDILKKLFPRHAVWEIKTLKKAIYLTFDDGPIPDVTDWVVNILEKYQAKATFFCLGKNVNNNPALYKMLMDAGHSIGNHSYSHPNGWKTNTKNYIEDVEQCTCLASSSLFRPPYGKIKPSQFRLLKRKYIFIMWGVLSGDFDPLLDKEKCLKNILKNTANGSIVVFHDNLKAKEKLQYVLPKFLEHFTNLGYSFLPLSAEIFRGKG